ncbi:zinc-binding alcohol dehydrogenase [Patescibacteria group bacterium]|nr:zinc-binding alcohol dehydrogenase [Patescibacteria group bacterium]
MQAKSVIISGKKKLEVFNEEIDPNELKTDQCLIKTDVSIVSPGTELATFFALSPGVYKKGSRNAYPCRPGYGTVGKIIGLGDDIKNFSIGDRVFTFGPHSSLQKYKYDQSGFEPYKAMFKVENKLDSTTAVIARMGLIALTAPQISGFKVGDRIVIFGLGFVGNLVAQLFQIGGADVYAFDVLEARCNIARSVGIKNVFNTSSEKQVEHINDLMNGKGAKITIDAVGHSQIIQNCIRSTAEYGQIILLGSPRLPVEGNLTEIFRTIHLNSITLKGALEWRIPAYPVIGCTSSIQENLQILWQLIMTGQLKVDELITHHINPEELGQTYMGLHTERDKYFGVIINWD